MISSHVMGWPTTLQNGSFVWGNKSPWQVVGHFQIWKDWTCGLPKPTQWSSWVKHSRIWSFWNYPVSVPASLVGMIVTTFLGSRLIPDPQNHEFRRKSWQEWPTLWRISQGQEATYLKISASQSWAMEQEYWTWKHWQSLDNSFKILPQSWILGLTHEKIKSKT